MAVLLDEAGAQEDRIGAIGGDGRDPRSAVLGERLGTHRQRPVERHHE
jgi:hypothetical protein